MENLFLRVFIEDRNFEVSNNMSSKISALQEEAEKELLPLESEFDNNHKNNSTNISTGQSN